MVRFAWDVPSDPVFIDLETQSPVSLPAVGSKAYVNCPDTRLLCAVAIRGNTCVVWVPPGRAPDALGGINVDDLWPEGWPRDCTIGLYVNETPDEMQDWLRDGRRFVAHNAEGFDAMAWARLVPGPQPTWFDTIPLARAAGLPGSLDEIGKRLLGRGKTDSTALRMLFTAKIKDDRCVYNVGTVPLWRDVIRYNIADVLLLQRIFHHVKTYGETDVLRLHSEINARGIRFDRSFCDALWAAWGELERRAHGRIAELTGGALTADNIRSGPQVKRWLESQGLKIASLNRQQLELLYDEPEDFFKGADADSIPRVIEVLKLRQSANRAGKGKIARLYSLADEDQRLRDLIVYHGAHTGRFSGRGIQPHNMARGVPMDLEGVFTRFTATGRIDLESLDTSKYALDDLLATLFRPVFCAPEGFTLGIVDYGQVEARGVAWVAGEGSLLDLFADTKIDLYRVTAAKLWGIAPEAVTKDQRQIAKNITLGCGYGMGWRKFGAYCALNRIDLEAAGTNAKKCVAWYRGNYPRIGGKYEGVWRRYERAAFAAVEGSEAVAGKCEFFMRDGHLHVRLPSGRCLVYRNASIQPREPGWAKPLGLDVGLRPTLVYAHPHKPEGVLYGGLITENIVQAICRDLLCDALLKLSAAGFPIVLHVHDEVVMELPAGTAADDIRRAGAIMSTPPAWAAGFPLTVEGFTNDRYTKGPFKNSHHVKAIGGRVL